MDTSIESVNDLKKCLSSALVDARLSHHIAKARQSAYTARKYCPANYKVGDKVWVRKTLFRDAVSRAQQSEKLGAKRFGPFDIAELIGPNTVRLKLPEKVRIHQVVHVVHTIRFLPSLQISVNLLPPSRTCSHFYRPAVRCGYHTISSQTGPRISVVDFNGRGASA